MKREDWRDTGAGVAVGTAAAIDSAQSYADKSFPRGMGFSGFGGGGACDGHYSSHVIVCHTEVHTRSRKAPVAEIAYCSNSDSCRQSVSVLNQRK